MGVTDPLRTELDRQPWKHFLGEDSPAHATVGLQDQWTQTRFENLSGGDHPREAGPHDDDVGLEARWVSHAATNSHSTIAEQPPIARIFDVVWHTWSLGAPMNYIGTARVPSLVQQPYSPVQSYRRRQKPSVDS
jgi:hypothetical protein